MNPGADGTAVGLTATVVRALVLYALAECQSGAATTLWVSADGDRFSVADDGRGHALDKVVGGTSYLEYIYTHFDYPFGQAQGAPVQLQGIGMSLVNALCAELELTVRRHDEVLEAWFRDGRLHAVQRGAAVSGQTGVTLAGRLDPRLLRDAPAVEPLGPWLQQVLASCPTLKLFFNGAAL